MMPPPLAACRHIRTTATSRPPRAAPVALLPSFPIRCPAPLDLASSKVLEDLASEPTPAPAPAMDDFDGNYSSMGAPMAARANIRQSIEAAVEDLAQVGSCMPLDGLAMFT